jgi:hypothetical protein
MHGSKLLVVSICAMLVASAYTLVHGQDDLLAINVERELQLIEGHMREFNDLLVGLKLQQARATMRLVEDRMALIRKKLERPARQEIEGRIASLMSQMKHREDSLVTVLKEKTANEGMEAGIAYSQTVLRRIGLPEERFQEIDQFLLEEAPKAQQRKETAAIDRAVKALEQGRGVPDGIDPYLAMTAKQIVQDRRDSVRAAQEEARRRDRDKDAAARAKEEEARKKEEAALRKERETRERQELEAARAEHEALDKERREREERLAAEERELEEIARVKQERDEKQARAEGKQAESERTKQAAERERQAKLAAEQERLALAGQEKAANAERERAEQLASEEQARVEAEQTSSPDAPQVTFRATYEAESSISDKDEEALRKQEDEERQKRVETARREEERIREIDRLNRGESPFHETAAASGETRSVQEYMRRRKEEEKKAQEVAVRIYDLVERKRSDEALGLFRTRRDYLGEYLSKEVFVVLERSVVSSKAGAAAPATDVAMASPRGELPKEEQHVMRIRQYLKDRKWGTAVSLFDGTKKELKSYLTKEEFKKIKALVDSAREYVKK